MRIISNGSKWAGESPDDIEELLVVLAHHTLNPFFEEFGRFVTWTTGGRFSIFGNFLDISHVFQIQGRLDEIRPLARAIRDNRRSARYKAAYIEQFGSELDHKRRHMRLRRRESRRRRCSRNGIGGLDSPRPPASRRNTTSDKRGLAHE